MARGVVAHAASGICMAKISVSQARRRQRQNVYIACDVLTASIITNTRGNVRTSRLAKDLQPATLGGQTSDENKNIENTLTRRFEGKCSGGPHAQRELKQRSRNVVGLFLECCFNVRRRMRCVHKHLHSCFCFVRRVPFLIPPSPSPLPRPFDCISPSAPQMEQIPDGTGRTSESGAQPRRTKKQKMRKTPSYATGAPFSPHLLLGERCHPRL
jgi:hypothetical protein